MTVTQASYDSSVELDSSLQILIETRLDILDRILLGRVSRGDRLSILREVESQIEELIAQKEQATLSRSDLLEILGRIDPPEAYLPEDYEDETPRLARRRPIAGPRMVRAVPVPTSPSRTGLLGGILGLSSIALVFLLAAGGLGAGMLLESEPIFLVGIFLASFFGLAGGIAGLILGILGRTQGVMAIIGIVSGILGVILSVVVPLGAFFIV